MSGWSDRASVPASDSALHPLDVDEARGYYLVAALLRWFVSPSVLTALMLLLWVVSDNVWTPVVGPLLGLTVTAYVERRFRFDAWAYIPRRRQDAGRDEPIVLAGLARGAEVAFLFGAVSAFVSSVGVQEVPTAAGSVALGSLAGLALAVVVTFCWDHSAPRDHRFAPSPTIVTDLASVATLLILGGGMLLLSARIAIDLAGTMIGFAVIVGALTVWLLLRLVPVRVRCIPPNVDMP
ncbi:hypothetical protein [Microbacterium sp. C7(2022)]|uniref:hypothetical protein n=1 Tax=Microbacterium sp. C7(2022) TaxID=2992759 RepID=UPI00237A65B9|nr:hypothetical protein [Microbacterium sp. C7(2022)]MDE0546268.1 hypothetical protein [Microbacterium sp. C7(2022)]